MRFLQTIVVLLVVGAFVAQPAAAQDENLPFKIHEAIRTGVNWLKKKQHPQEGHFGEASGPTYAAGGTLYPHKAAYTAFALYCLLKCDVPVTDPVITKGFQFIRSSELKGVYEHAVVIMAFRELYHYAVLAYAKRKFEKSKNPESETDKFMEKLEPGSAAYGMSKLAGAQGQQDWQLVDKLTKKLIGWQNANQGWRYGDLGGNDGAQDISATHLALFGLKAALACNVQFDKGLFAGAATYLLAEQELQGEAVKQENPGAGSGNKDEGGSWTPMTGDRARGWAYMSGSAKEEEKTRTGGMTAAALIGLMACKSELMKTPWWKKEGQKVDQAINDGIAFLNVHWVPNLTSNPPHGNRTGYFWWAVERTGVLGAVQMIGQHNWYIEGAMNLVAIQQPVDKDNGFWDIKHEVEPTDLLNTIYALLFLKKTDHAIGIPPVTRGGR